MLPSTFIKELLKENLCTYFVLSWLHLSKLSFVSFVNTYLTADGKFVVVQVVDVNLVFSRVMRHPQFAGLYKKDGYYYLSYRIPVERRGDTRLFIQGKYSQMSEEAKALIRQHSSLLYKQRTKTGVTTDGRLFALDKDPLLKDMWEGVLSQYDRNVRSNVCFTEDAELLSIPDEKSFIDLSDAVQLEA